MTTSDQIKLFCIGLSVVLKHRPASPEMPATSLPHPALETVQEPPPAVTLEAHPAGVQPLR
jgi:hypothetical protein